MAANSRTRRREQKREANSNQHHPSQIAARCVIGNVNVSYWTKEEAGKDKGGSYSTNDSCPRSEEAGNDEQHARENQGSNIPP